MKKLFYYTLAAFSLFFIGNLDVSALEMKADEIGNRTYVIGTHMFTREKNESIGYDGKLTTERLMLASKTIEGNSLDDMIVYYKNPFGIWTNGITGEEIEAPESFNLEYKDTMELLRTPTIEQSGFGVSIEGAGISFLVDDYDESQEVEVYYSTSEDGEYGLLETVEVSEISENGITVIAPKGYHYYFKIKLVKTDNGITSRSDYSNILDVDSSFNSAPVISRKSYGSIDPETGENNTALGVEEFNGLVEIYYATSENGEYELYSEASFGNEETGDFDVTISLGSHYYFKARYVSADGKVFSDYSNVVDVDNTIAVPTLALVERVVNSNGEMELDIFSNSPQKYRADIIEIYRATSEDGEYELLDSYEGVEDVDTGELIYNGYYDATVPLNTHYFYKIRVGISVGEDIVYSDYSNVVDYKYEFSTPTISLFNVSEQNENGEVTVTLFLDRALGNIEIYYATSKDGEYSLLRTEYINSSARAVVGGTTRYFDVSVPLGSHYYFKVRFVSNDGSVYSDYSNVVDYANNLVEPTITGNFGGANTDSNEVDYYLTLEDYSNADSIEVYRSTGEDGEYELLETIEVSNISDNGISVIIPYGVHYFYKVRLVKTIDSKVIYSDYSNVADFDNTGDWTIDTATNTLVSYNGDDSFVEIPAEVNGVEITTIAEGAFKSETVVDIKLSANITKIEDGAILKENNPNLKSIGFLDGYDHYISLGSWNGIIGSTSIVLDNPEEPVYATADNGVELHFVIYSIM